MSGQVSGYFISFTPAEKRELDETLEELGYSPDIEGMKAWIFDTLRGDREQANHKEPVDRIVELLKENPQYLLHGANAAKGLASAIASAIKKARP